MTAINEDVLFVAEFVDNNGSPYDPTPAPTVAVNRYNASDGSGETLVSGQASIDSTITGRFSYILDSAENDALGTLEAVFVTSDTNLLSILRTAYASEVVEPAVAVDLTEIEAALDTLLARTSGAAGVTIVSPVREVGGETEIVIKQGETMSAALGSAIVLTFTGVPDTSGCTCVLTFTDQNGRLLSSVTGNPFTGTLGTWAAGSVTATWELSAAQTALFPASRNDKEDLERHNLRFEAKITGYASSGVLKPVMPKTGNVRVVTAAWTS